MRRVAQSCPGVVMSVSESTSVATASLATSSSANQSAAMENAWAEQPLRTYFVDGYRVKHESDGRGHHAWVCDCAEYSEARRTGSRKGCSHTQRIAASVELDRLLRTPGLILPKTCY